MMKRLFIVLFILCSLSGMGQNTFPVTGTFGTKTTGVKTQGAHYIDSALFLPIKDTTWTPARAGELTMRPQDTASGILHIFNGAATGKKWYAIALDYVYSTRLYDSYNSHDTLTQSRGIWMQAYGLTFYSSDGTTQNATGINNDGFTTKRGNGSLTQNSTWVYGQIQDPTATYVSRFQVIGLVNDSTHSAQLVSTNNNNYNEKAALVSAAWWEGVKLQANVNWKTSGATTGYKGLSLYSTNGDGTGELTIDKEVIPEGTGQALLYDSVTKQVYRGTASGGGSTTTALTDVSDAAPVNNSTLVYNQDSAKYVPTPVATYNLTDPQNGQVLTYRSGVFVNEPADSIAVTGTTNRAKFEFRPSDTALLVTYGGTVFSFKQSGTGGSSPVGGYDTDAQAYFTRFETAGGTLTTAQKSAINDLIVYDKAQGLYTDVAEYFFIADAANASRAHMGFKEAHTLSNSGAFNYSDKGLKGDGVAAYLTTGIIPATHLPANYSLSAYIYDAGTATAPFQIGANKTDATGYSYLSVRSGNIYAGINGLEVSVATAFVAGQYDVVLEGGTTVKLYRNGVDMGGTTSGTAVVPTSDFYVAAMHDKGASGTSDAAFGFADNRLSFIGFGPTMTATQAADRYTKIQAIQTAFGRAVP